MTVALERGEWSAARPGRTLPLGKTRYLFYRRLCGLQGRSGQTENLVSTRVWSRTVQAGAQSLYRLSYPAQNYDTYVRYNVPAVLFNPLMPNDRYRGRTAPLTSKRCILYIYSTNIGTEYFKHGLYSPSFSLQNAICFTILTYLVPVLFTFYTECVQM